MKIGRGGTVAVLGHKKTTKAIENIADKYEKLTGHQPYIFSGSSSGANDFGFMKLSGKL